MQEQSKHKAPTILANMKQEREESADQQRAEERQTIYVYRTSAGGVLFSPVKLAGENPPDTDGEPDTPIVDSNGTVQPTTRAAFCHRVLFLLQTTALALLFLFLDSIAPILAPLFTPTATVTLIPQVYRVAVQSTMPLGRLTAPITLSQSQSAPATGKGHQEARQASGTITLYNGLASSQSVVAGTMITGADGRAVVTEASVSVPPDTPPDDGVASVAAHAVLPGTSGNMAAGDINTSLATGLYARNLTAFTGGLDERTFSVIRQQDIDAARTGLQQRVLNSMDAALNGERQAGEELVKQPCTAALHADRQAGDEAPSVTVTVSLTCQAVIYNTTDLQAKAAKELAAHVLHTYGSGYVIDGTPHITVTKATIQARSVMLTLRSSGSFAYAISMEMQQHLKIMLSGKPRLSALQYVITLPGIRQAAITGIQKNEKLPDRQHIQVLIVVLVS